MLFVGKGGGGWDLDGMDGWVSGWMNGLSGEGLGKGGSSSEYSMSMVRSWGGVGWIGVDWGGLEYVCGDEGGEESGEGGGDGIVDIALIDSFIHSFRCKVLVRASTMCICTCTC